MHPENEVRTDPYRDSEIHHAEPPVSIVIPVYNGADYMRQAIDSALSQTLPGVEVIVVNDGSTDGGATEEIALSYGSAIRYIRQENGGVAAALNAGIKAARGEYISWLSHDDIYLPRKVELQLARIRELPPRSVIYGNYYVIDAASNIIGTSDIEPVEPHDFVLSCLIHARTNGCTVLAPRAAFLDAGGFDPTLRTTQDYDMWFRLNRDHDFHLLEEPLVMSRVHAAQGTRVMPETCRQESDRLFAGVMDLFEGGQGKFDPARLAPVPLLMKRCGYYRAYRRSFPLAWANRRGPADTLLLLRALFWNNRLHWSYISRLPGRIADILRPRVQVDPRSVLMVTPSFYPSRGGVEKHLLMVGRSLTAAGWKVSVLTWNKPGNALYATEKLEGMDVYRIPLLPLPRSRQLGLAVWMLSHPRILASQAVLHCHDVGLIPFRLLAGRKPLVLTCHGYESYPVPERSIRGRRISRRLADFIFGIADTGPFYGVNYDHVLYGAAPFDRPVEPPPEDRRKFLFIGRLEEDTGIMEFLEGVCLARREHGLNIDLTVCGRGSLEQAAREYAAGCSLAVEFRGHVDDIVAAIDESAVVFAGGCLAILESMSRHRPVIAFCRTPIKEHMLETFPLAGQGFRICRSPREIAFSAFEIADSPAVYEGMVREMKARMGSFTWEALAEEYAGVYRSLTASSGASSERTCSTGPGGGVS